MIAFPNLVVPSLNDGGFQTRPINPNQLELAAAWYNDPIALSAMRKRYETGASRSSMEAWQFGEELPEGESYTPPPSIDLSGAGLVILRAGSGKDAVCAMLEYGEHGGGHGHPDKLQLILYGLGKQLCPDLGTTGYANPLHPNYYKRTPAHNTITINGQNMSAQSSLQIPERAENRRDYKPVVCHVDIQREKGHHLAETPYPDNESRSRNAGGRMSCSGWCRPGTALGNAARPPQDERHPLPGRLSTAQLRCYGKIRNL